MVGTRDWDATESVKILTLSFKLQTKLNCAFKNTKLADDINKKFVD